MASCNRCTKLFAFTLYSPGCLEEKFSETELPTLPILGNWVSGVQNSRKLNFYHYSFSETQYVGVVLHVADWGCMHDLPPNGVLGNSGMESAGAATSRPSNTKLPLRRL